MFFDTLIEDMPDSMFLDRPWGKDDNSQTVVWQYLNEHGQFVIDADIPAKLQIIVASIGWFSKVD
ncbi:CmcI family methyltransferase [Aeromonas enteropelogenes]|uniref:CmcI family methyltransferase n=1 Tax=Aeromonas enteropelogenes TaxID=29489 RepID=UPI003B9F14C7